MSSYKTKKTPGNTSWFTKDRFGMYIHWGLYALPARHEWVKRREGITDEHYDKYFKYFDPDMCDMKEWARMAREAGMKYAVITTKHHEGFCLFDSKYTDYKVTNTKAGRDLVREFTEAFRAEGLRVGFYYSLLDWHHPHYTIDFQYPRAQDPGMLEKNKGRDMHIYAEYMRNQVTELLTNYGKIDIMWFDFSFPHDPKFPDWMKGKGKEEWESDKLIALVRKLQPDIIINNRTGIEQDLWNPEQYQPREWVTHEETGELVTWEACHTLSGSWGYHRDEMTWKSPEMLIHLLINSVAFGGNLLLNVGPTARGYLDRRAQDALKVYANWIKYHGRSIYGCTMAEPEFKAPSGCRLTQSLDGKRLYIHFMEYPYRYVELPNWIGKVDYAQFLHDGSEIKLMEWDRNRLVLEIPVVKPDVIVPVAELFLTDRGEENKEKGGTFDSRLFNGGVEV